jgi:hypothetical protein
VKPIQRCAIVGGWKIDFIIRRARPFSITEFDRRFEIEVQGLRLYIATAEDVIPAPNRGCRRHPRFFLW